jgi:hypothetical protein
VSIALKTPPAMRLLALSLAILLACGVVAAVATEWVEPAFVESAQTIEGAKPKMVLAIIDESGSWPQADLTRFKKKAAVVKAGFVHDPALRETEKKQKKAPCEKKKKKDRKGKASKKQNPVAPPAAAPVAAQGVKDGFLNGIYVGRSAVPIETHRDRRDYRAWRRAHNYKFSRAENAARYILWRKNHRFVERLNLRHGNATFHATGPFAHLHRSEFRKLYLTTSVTTDPFANALIESQAKEGQAFFASMSDDQALELGPVDWTRISTKVKDQDKCAASWAFVAAEVLESAVARAGRELTELSVQSLIDCNRQGNNGCQGGNSRNAYAYWESHAASTAANYRWLGAQGVCKATAGVGPIIKTSGFAIPPCTTGACPKQAEAKIIAALHHYGPLGAMVDGSILQHYTHGIITPDSGARRDFSKMNHAVTIVAYRPKEGKTPAHWVVRSSWGKNFGEGGLFRLSYGANTAGIANQVTYVTV